MQELELAEGDDCFYNDADWNLDADGEAMLCDHFLQAIVSQKFADFL